MILLGLRDAEPKVVINPAELKPAQPCKIAAKQVLQGSAAILLGRLHKQRRSIDCLQGFTV